MYMCMCILAQNLEEISMCSNRIAQFAEGIPQLKQLRHLYVADNHIQRLPIEFHKLVHPFHDPSYYRILQILQYKNSAV